MINLIVTGGAVVFLVLGGADYLLGGRLGLGGEFERGILAAGRLLMCMTGLIVLAPVLAQVLALAVSPVLRGMGADPSALAGLFFANDSGGSALAMALADGNAKPEDVSYINAHGTSTHLNDAGETAAIKTIFGDHAYQLAVSSTKSMTGHMLGAAGAVEAIFTALALRDGYIPATIHYQIPDPECDLDVVPNQGREAEIRCALSNSLGFGGHNGSLLLKKWEA